jgi:hypothetical protein
MIILAWVSEFKDCAARCLHSVKGRCAIFKTGTGFADAKLSEILPAARVAPFVRMTETALALLASVG